MTEDRETRLKRLRLRSWRRGTKEMDLILGGFADAVLSELSDHELDAHEALMAEHDHDLYVWISDQQVTPDELQEAISIVKKYVLEKKL